jgi:predicted extracellular nuclease
MSATAGKVALVQATTALSGACPTGTPISDFVGYGTAATCFEGAAAAPGLTNTTSAQRGGGGATDTDNNAADFTAGSPSPVNGADPAPTVVSTNPTNGQANVPVGSNISINFSEPVNVSGAWFDISCTTSGSHTAVVSGGSTSFTLAPDTDFATTETCTVTVVAAQVSDQDTDDPPDTMAANYAFSFSTEGPVCEQAFTPIHTLQGSGANTPAPGTYTTRGVVVGDFEGTAGAQGFYIQDPAPDADPLTSEGIFVFTGSANLVNLGDAIAVTGFVRERFNQTAIQGSNSNTAAVPPANIAICSTGNPLPSPTEVTLPYDAINLLEPYEGMRVVFPQSLVISEYFNYARFGEIVLALPLDGEPRPFTGTAIDEPGAAANARTLANSLRRITLDDVQSAQNPPVLRHPNGDPFSLDNMFRGGDIVTDAIGVLGFDFSLYRIYPTGPAAYEQANPRPPAPEPVGGTLHVAAMNTLNYFLTLNRPNTTPPDPLDNVCGGMANLECRGADSDQPQEFPRQRAKLLAALAGLNADVIGLNELENTPGVDPVGDIVSGLNDIFGAGTYAGINTGVIGTDAIKVGLIYKPASVTPVGAFKTLTSAVDPRFIDTRSRPTLAQTFVQNVTGERFTVAVNHLKSKGSACAGDPDTGDGQGNCSGTRTLAAQALVDWLATDPTGSGDPDFLIMGDLNSYAQEDPIDAIKAGSDDTAGTGDDYVNLIAQYQGLYAYSYTFDGQAGYLDHALANASMTAQVTRAADWHINSDEPNVVDYDTTFKPPAQEALYEANGNRSSDHDPVMVGLNLDSAAPDTTIDTHPDDPTNSTTAVFTFSGTDSGSGVDAFECDLDGAGFAECASPAEYLGLGAGSHTFQVRAVDTIGNVDPTPDSFTWTIDTAAPTVTINQAATQADPTTVSPIHFTVTFSEVVTGFSDADVTLSGTAGATTAVVTGGPTSFDVAVSGMSGGGTVIATVTAGAATDAAGNDSAASTNTDNTVTFSIAPTAAVTNGECSGSSAASGSVNVTISDPDSTTLDLALVSNSNVALVPNANVVIGGAGANRTITVSAVAKRSGTATLTFALSDETSTVPFVVTVRVGTDGNDTLSGTSGVDVMFGLGGRDTINGLDGNDLLCGGTGDDTLNGGDGADVLDGEKGDDILSGGSGGDRLRGGAGGDSLTGGAGADSFSGGSGSDVNTDFAATEGDTSDGT